MSLLLDSHALVWFVGGSPLLSAAVRQRVADIDEEMFVSAASIYEIEWKVMLGKLPVALSVALPRALEQLDIAVLPIDGAVARVAARLASAHRDPWDRLIAGQAISANLVVASKDTQIKDLGAEVFW